MGTYYRVQFNANQHCQVQQGAIDDLLLAFNQDLSTYIPQSQISLINHAPANMLLPVGDRLALVFASAKQVWQQSDGAFDVTIGPLVNLWGFGPEAVDSLPSESAQKAAAQHVGMPKIVLEDDSDTKFLRKEDASVYLDFSALAKGYGVDEVAVLLSGKGCTDYLVDIGGEVRGLGVNRRGIAWRIGVEVPDSNGRGLVQRVLQVQDRAVATSGDYRNFRRFDGVRVDHVIDPRNGLPAANDIVSATVVHPQAMLADAYATTLMVLGMDAGMAFAQTYELPVLLIAKSADGGFIERYTDVMATFFVAPAE